MQVESAILGIFLATYSSKGDHLPLRYPLTNFDYEYARTLLEEAKAAEARKRSTKGSSSSNNTGSRGSGDAAGQDAKEAGAEKGIAELLAVDTRTAAKGVPSRTASYTSVALADTPASTPASASASATAPNSTGSAAQGNKSNRASGAGDQAEPRESNAAGSSAVAGDDSERLFADGPLSAEMERNADKRPCMPQPMHGFDTKFLAQLFSPKPSMSDQRFQVAIDKVLFVGHPLRDDPKERAKDPGHYDTEQDDAETMSRFASLADIDGWKVKSDLLAGRASRQKGTNLLADLGLINLVLPREPSDAGDSAISEAERAVRDSREWKKRGYNKPSYDSMFHVVFMLDNTVPGIEIFANLLYEHVLKRLAKVLLIEQTESNYVLTESRLIRSLNDMALTENYTTTRYLQELMRLSTLATDLIRLYNGLRQGELVNLHVRKRIMVSLQIPRGPRLERPLPAAKPRPFFHTGFSASGYNTNNLGDLSNVVSAAHTPRPATPCEGGSSGSEILGFAHQRRLALLDISSPIPQTVAPAIQEYWGPPMFAQDANTNAGHSSSLARSSAAHGLSARSAHAHAGGRDASRSMHAHQSAVLTERELQPNEHGRYPRIEPYHAVLLLDDAEKLKRRLLYADASPTLVAVIDKASPTKTLSVLHTMVDCSFAQLCRLVAHLVYWNVARVICPVKLNFTYVPAVKQLTPELIGKYSRQGFGLCSLPRLFACLHPPRPAAQVLQMLTSSTASAPPNGAGDSQELRAQEQRSELRQIIVFLLREGAIAQYHTWPVLLVPNYVKFDLSQEQFVNLAFAWFRSLYTEHPDLLGAFPSTLLNRSELHCWREDERRERDDIEVIYRSFRDAESQVMLCRVMRKIALKRVRDKWCEKMRGRHGQELRRMEEVVAAEEDKVHGFCNRIEKEKLDTWIEVKDRHDTSMAQMRKERIGARRAKGKEIPGEKERETEIFGPSSDAYKWYDFVESDPDISEFTKEVVEKYVTYVPADGVLQGSDAERRYIQKLIEAKPSNTRDWFVRHSHLFNGRHHLVKLLEHDQTSVPRLEATLKEFSGILLLPQHT
ncbi:hypothetical protein GQ54DRAFT_85435 [Martensiomyces pterosporus]|nr:hypothetical protein GQ54DRAFT_85435 [Martensiomyces pterosporus]